jgi:hypothetical protein
MGETIGEARSSCQHVLSLPNTPFTTFARCYVRFRGIAEADRRALLVDRHVNDPTRTLAALTDGEEVVKSSRCFLTDPRELGYPTVRLAGRPDALLIDETT